MGDSLEDGRLAKHQSRRVEAPRSRRYREDNVPLIVVKMLEGRSVEQKRRLVREMTNVVVKYTGAPEDQVDVIIEDYPRENWAKAGTLFYDK
jgi:4-oxalocrotonate tautomerase